jgi:hypothetical protein
VVAGSNPAVPTKSFGYPCSTPAKVDVDVPSDDDLEASQAMSLLHLAVVIALIAALWWVVRESTPELNHVARVPWSISLGYAFMMPVIASGAHLLNLAGVALTTTSWLVVGIVTVVTVGLFVSWARHGMERSRGLLRLHDLHGWACTVVALLISLHVGLAFLNNLSRPIFPWDALTTWMYRAKAWTLLGHLQPMLGHQEWLAAGGGEGYAIHASHYPEAVSVIAALFSSLAGDWSAALASLPWSMTLFALALISYSLFRQAGVNNLLALVGAYFLISMPLVSAHSALAGYGDLWMMLYAGCGLTSLLVWRVSGRWFHLLVGLALLAASPLFKLEGWLWAGLGLAFIGIEILLERLGAVVITWAAAVVCALLLSTGTTYFDLGLLGAWGIDGETVFAGPLGAYAMRPINPLIPYILTIFSHTNFHLLGALVVVAIIIGLVKSWAGAGAFLRLLVYVAGVQLVIFGLSEYSQYAESGTAHARLLLQITPVLVAGVIFGLNSLTVAGRSSSDVAEFGWRASGLSVLLGLAAIAASLTLLSQVPALSDASDKLQIDGSDLVAVVGEARYVDEGVSISASPAPFGVLRAPTESIDPERMCCVHVSWEGLQSPPPSFYWRVRGQQGGVHTVELSGANTAFVQLSADKRWGNPLEEVGLIFQSEGYGIQNVQRLTFGSPIMPVGPLAAFEEWLRPIPFDQSSLNTVRRPGLGLYNPTTVFNFAAVMLCLAWVLFRLVSKLSIVKNFRQCALLPVTSVIALWCAADLVWLFNYVPITQAAVSCEGCGGGSPEQEGLALTLEAEEAARTLLASDQPAVVVSASPVPDFEMYRLPFMMLPARAVAAGRGAASIPTDWYGAVLVVGASEAQASYLADQFSSSHPVHAADAPRSGRLRFMLPNLPPSGIL